MTWFIARAATRQEDRAEKSLKEAFKGVDGFDVYVIRQTRWERLGRQKEREKKQRPYLPGGYLFVRIPNGDFRAAEAADGMHDMLRYVNRAGLLTPRDVPPGMVEAFRQAEASGEFDRTLDVSPGLRVGSRVRLTSGPFAGLVGQIKAQRNQGRVRVLLDAIFGAPVKPVQVDPEDLELYG